MQIVYNFNGKVLQTSKVVCSKQLFGGRNEKPVAGEFHGSIEKGLYEISEFRKRQTPEDKEGFQKTGEGMASPDLTRARIKSAEAISRRYRRPMKFYPIRRKAT